MPDIHITGPKNYRHQDRVAAWLTLEFPLEPIEVLVEPADGEDFRLTSTDPTRGVSVFEFQVKNEREQFSVERLVDCLLHFKGDIPLIARLCSEENLRLVFVIASRAQDDVAEYVISEVSSLLNPNRGIPAAKKKVLVELLKSCDPIPPLRQGPQRDRRADRLRKAKEELTNDVCDRIFILEKITEAECRRFVLSSLQHKHKVPYGACEGLSDIITNTLVFNSRGVGEDIGQAILKKASDHSKQSLFPGDEELYVFDDGLYRDRLNTHGYLLLTGNQGAGKSWLASHLGSELQKGAFNTVETDGCAPAIKFLRTSAAEDRVAIVDDFAGGSSLNETKSIVRDLRLIEEWRHSPVARRYLIVTSRKDLLEKLTNKGLMSDGIRLSDWSSVSTSLSEKESLWDKLCEKLGLEPDDKSRGMRVIQRNSLVEALAITRLARFCQRRPGASSELMRAELFKGGREILVDIICEEPELRQTLQIAYLLLDLTTGLSLDDIASHLATPDGAPGLLDSLEERGVLRCNNTYTFTHPDYQYGAICSFLDLATNQRKAAVKLIESVIKTPLAGIGLQVFQRIRSLVTEIGDRQTRSDLLAVLANFEAESLDVIDIQIRTLIEFYEVCTEDTLSALSKTVQNSKFGGEELDWDSGRPTRPKSTSPAKALYKIEEPELEALSANHTEYELWRAVVSNSALSSHLVDQALDSSTPATRAVAALKYLYRGSDIVTRRATGFLRDLNPFVFLRAFQGLLLLYSRDRSVVGDELIQASYDVIRRRPIFGFVLLNSIGQFSQWQGWSPEWYHGHTFPWEIATGVVCAALESCPPSLPVDNYRLLNFCDEVLERLAKPDNGKTELCKALVENLIFRAVERAKLKKISDIPVPAVRYVSRLTGCGISWRLRMIQNLFSVSDSQLQLSSYQAAALMWSDLDDVVKREVRKALDRGGRLADWFRAAALLAAHKSGLARTISSSNRQPLALAEGLEETVSCRVGMLIVDHRVPYYISERTFFTDKQFWRKFLSEKIRRRLKMRDLEIYCKAAYWRSTPTQRARDLAHIAANAAGEGLVGAILGVAQLLAQDTLDLENLWFPLVARMPELKASDLRTVSELLVNNFDMLHSLKNLKAIDYDGFHEVFVELVPSDWQLFQLLTNLDDEEITQNDFEVQCVDIYTQSPPRLHYVRNAVTRAVSDTKADELEALMPHWNSDFWEAVLPDLDADAHSYLYVHEDLAR